MIPKTQKARKSLQSGSLVNITESSAPSVDVICKKTGEFHRFSRETGRELFAATDARSERFKLQRLAAEILSFHENPKGKRYRIAVCHSHMTGEHVHVVKSVEHQKASYKGLMFCGSVWTCAVCSAKISQRRSAEITAAMNTHFEAGFRCMMVTLTFPHKRQDSLHDLRERQAKALKILRQSKQYKAAIKASGYVGMIRALELTHGVKNGWHPHTHENWFITGDMRPAQLKKRIFPLWVTACEKAGLPKPNYKHGVDIREAFSPNEYLAKFGREQSWGTGAELTASIAKRSFKGRSPFDLLRAVLDSNKPDPRERELFAEFAHAFYGARQLFWSKGLKELMCIEQLSDQEIVDSNEDETKEVCSISGEAWKFICKGTPALKADILTLAETGGFDAVNRLVTDLTGQSGHVVRISSKT